MGEFQFGLPRGVVHIAQSARGGNGQMFQLLEENDGINILASYWRVAQLGGYGKQAMAVVARR